MNQTVDPADARAYADAARLLQSGMLAEVDRCLAPRFEAGTKDARLYAVAGFALGGGWSRRVGGWWRVVGGGWGWGVVGGGWWWVVGGGWV